MRRSGILKSLPGIFASGTGEVSLRLARVLLYSLLLMAVLTPLLQLDSLDRFPVTTDDIEVQVTYCLSTVALLLVLAQVLKLIPLFLQGKVDGLLMAVRPLEILFADARDMQFESPPPAPIPLRV